MIALTIEVKNEERQRIDVSVNDKASQEVNVYQDTVFIPGDNGATFYPNVSEDGIISWTNDKGLENPDPVDIKGSNGKDGADGYTPVKGVDYFDGKDGYTPVKGVDYFDGKDGYTPVKGVDYFDGEKGDKGDTGKDGYTPIKGKDYFDGVDGKDGYTPVKGVDYFDGEKGDKGDTGAKGAAGKDGVSCTHRWSGTTLVVTSASGSSSMNLKGDKGDTGSAGKDGVDGYSPVKGTDYYTPAERQSIVDDVLSALKHARIGSVTLFADKWVGSNNLYSQVVSIEGVTDHSQVDLTPDVEQLAVFYEKDITFVTENEDSVVTVYVIGQKPTNDYTIQVTITEVDI